jgi:cation:H+ antiporter
VHRQLVWIDVPIMIGLSAAAWAMAYDGRIGMVDGLIFLAAMLGYFALAVKLGRREGGGSDEVPGDKPRGAGPMLVQVVIIVVGLGLLLLGARWLVGGAVALAESLGIDQLVIALTVVAAGTSLPEIATSIIAAVRGQRDMAVGNIVGSNILNLAAILGASAVAAPDGLTVSPAAMWFDFPVMVAVAVACAPIFFTGHLIARWEGAVFLVYYVVYTAYVVLLATEHAALHTLQWALVVFAIPLTVLTLAVTLIRSVKHHRQRARGGGA